jgi:LysM repeat protein
MIRSFIAVFFTIIISNCLFAQQSNLEIRGTGSALFVDHKVVPKESFYSIARMFNVPPKDIAAYNSLQFEHGLNIGQTIKIPLSQNNFIQTGSAANGEALVPVYHSVLPKEGLYRVSINYNKVPLTSLKKWNHLTSDNVSIGTPLIVGYLKVNKNESPLATKGVKPDFEAVIVTKEDTKPEPVKPDINPERLPPVKNPDAQKQEQKNTEPPKQEQKIATTAETDEHKVTVTSVSTKSNINFSGGFFKKMYSDQTEKTSPVNENGSGGIFKSTSGWQDGKYYCFNNEVAPGTIIKITDNISNKSVYAKVLDAIPDIKQNSGLSIILSNAAAEELGVADKFDCALSYAK